MSLDDMAATFVHRLQDKFLGRNIFPRLRAGRSHSRLDEHEPESNAHELDTAPRQEDGEPRDLKRSQDDHRVDSAKRLCEECKRQLSPASAVEEPAHGSSLELFDRENAQSRPNDGMEDTEELPLDYEAEQEIRNSRYCTFEPEESPEDYTDGPCRWTFGNDGVRDCAVLLVPYYLSQKIQEVASEQRQYTQKEGQITEQLAEIAAFLSAVRVEIRVHKFKIEEDAGSGEQHDEGSDDAKASLANELQIMQEMLEEKEAQKVELEGKLRRLGDYLRESYTELMRDLDEAFTVAKLLEQHEQIELPVEHLDLQEQYQKYCARNQETGVNQLATPLPAIDTSRDFLMNRPPTPTHEQERIHALQQAAQQAIARFEAARQAYELRTLDQEQERAFNHDAWRNGTHPVDVDTAAFDARWLWLNHTITRELIEAEEAVRAARRAAKAGGLDVLSMAPSLFPSEGFETHPADGKCWSGSDLSEFNGERAISTSARPRVLEWLGMVGDEFESVHECPAMEVDVDEWAAREVELWDSASLTEERAEKRKLIDKWQQMCTAEREQLAT
ncbi:hypothetical protein CBER1_02717 [Cercospora berteroae]|uniref:Uncharacterized protein n=1 Tax=Cercospora berteroae TaxID=357750 RepID=A0A2S6C6N7_9PEZI|nr:hypothetical protein CBER1_02717 [Cercospora berteroae]